MPAFHSPKGKSQQCHLLLNMMILQSIGDVSGRMLAPTSKYLVLFLRYLHHPAPTVPKVWSALVHPHRSGGLHSFQACWLDDKGIKGIVRATCVCELLRSGPLQKKLPLLGGIVLPTCFACLVLAAVAAWHRGKLRTKAFFQDERGQQNLKPKRPNTINKQSRI